MSVQDQNARVIACEDRNWIQQWQKTVWKIYCDLQQELGFEPTAVPLLVGEVVRSEGYRLLGRHYAMRYLEAIKNHQL